MKTPSTPSLGIFSVAILSFLPTAQSAITLMPEADTEIRYNNTTDRSNSSFVNIKNSGDGSSVTRKGYFSFDLSSFTSGTATVASQFTLSLSSTTGATYTSGNNFFNVYGLNDATGVGTGFGEDWGLNQSDMTYNTTTGDFFVAPANDTGSGSSVTVGTGAFEATLLGTITIPNGSPLGVGTNFTLNGSGLADFLNADTNNLATIIVTRGGGGNSGANLIVGSVENSNAALRPTLQIETIPEPSSVALLGLGALGLFARRRR